MHTTTSVKLPPRTVLPGERWDLNEGRFLQEHEQSSGSVRRVQTETIEGDVCGFCMKPIVRGDLVDADLVHVHSACFELAEHCHSLGFKFPSGVTARQSYVMAMAILQSPLWAVGDDELRTAVLAATSKGVIT